MNTYLYDPVLNPFTAREIKIASGRLLRHI